MAVALLKTECDGMPNSEIATRAGLSPAEMKTALARLKRIAPQIDRGE